MVQKHRKKERYPLATGYLSEGNIHFRFSKYRFLDELTIYEKLGKSLVDFAWFDLNSVNIIFDDIWKKCVALKKNKDDYEFISMGLWLTIEKYLGLNSYFTMYLVTLINFLMEEIIDERVLTYRSEINKFAKEGFFVEEPTEEIVDTQKYLFISVFIKCIEERQKVVERTLDKILLSADDERQSTMIRLYQMEHEDRNFRKYWHSRFETFIGKVSNSSEQIDQLTMLETIDDMMRFELIQMVLHDVKYKYCQCCGKLFIPDGRSDSRYCDRIMPEQKHPCSKIGAHLVALEKRKKDPVLLLHRKAYDRMYNRIEMGYMKRSDFDVWNEEAKKKRDDCRAGKLSHEKFVRWIDETSRQRRGRTSQK
ncbi:MAG: DUF6076 domain-containing protein [Oscillospiraceae bacterium]|nr:DUF6076 domain-containing protein [Oscillospiraceae bacterium]